MKALTYDEWRRRFPREPAPFAIYDRYSSDLQDTSTGVNRQARCREFAAKENIRVVKVFYDEAKSGTSTVTRDQYRALLAEAMSPSRSFVGVVVFSSSRWGRAEDSEMDFLALQLRGVRIVSATEPAFQLEGAHGDLMRGILQKVNAFFSKQTGITTHAMQTANCREGFLNGGRAPDGYVKAEVPLGRKNAKGEECCRYRLELNERPGANDMTSEPRWRWIRIAVDMHLKQSKSLRTIARELDALGFKGPRKGGSLNPSNIRAAFRNARYTGYQVWNVRKWRKAEGRRRWMENPQEEWVWSKQPTHPPIITREEFELLWRRFMDRKHSNTSVRRQLLAGLLKCGTCGSGFVINSRKKKERRFGYLICSKKQRHGWSACPTKPLVMHVVEGAVEEAVLSLMSDPAFLRGFFVGLGEWLAEEDERAGAEKRSVEKEAAKIRAEIENFTRAIAASGAQAATLVSEISRRERRLEQLALATPPAGATGGLTWEVEEVALWAQRLRAVYFAVDMDVRRAVMGHIIREVVVDKNKSGRIVFDPTALLTLRDVWPDMPAEVPVRIQTGCGGWI